MEQKNDFAPQNPTEHKVICCIGDIHGHITKLHNLWSNLETLIDPIDFQSALIIFLGDYCDRGPDTKRVLDFLIALPSKYPNQRHVFLSGNHDFAFAAFLGVVPPPPDGSGFSETWKEYELSEDREGWYRGEGYETMHLQGRRWSGLIKDMFNKAKGTEYRGSIYDASPTFESYGVPHGSADLVKAVPAEHKKFLSEMVWVHEEDDVPLETEEGIKHFKLIAVHAGLEKKKDVDEQIKTLKARDTRISKVAALSGRKDVWDIPQVTNSLTFFNRYETNVIDLIIAYCQSFQLFYGLIVYKLAENPTIVVSGHHGKLFIEGLRLIIDEGGGMENNPIAAIILPSMKIVRDIDVM